jgi:general L-amino acid transport system substrate-binding protein
MLTQINLKLISVAIVALLLVGGCSNNEAENSKTKNDETPETTKTTKTTKTTDTTGMIVSRLNIVKSRGKLICGVNGQLPGFSFVDENGKYSGMDVDLCRAVAAAIFDYPSKVEFRDLDTEGRFLALESGEVDLLNRNTTWTLSRDTSVGMEFAPTTFYDGQGILVTNESEIEELEDLDGKSVCVVAGTTNEENLADHMRNLGLNYAPVVIEDADMLFTAYEEGRCEAASSDRSQLTVGRAGLNEPDNHQVLEMVLSKEPLGAVIADGDAQWFDVVKWVTYAMIEAEELGINSQNVASFAQTKDPKIRRFLGLEGNLGKEMGLPNDFTQRIIKHVGNYDEVYERNIGLPFDLERGQNALWTDDGLMYSPPFR